MVPVTDVVVKLDPIPTRPELVAHVTFNVGPVQICGARVVLHSNGQFRLHYPDMPKVARCGHCRQLIAITFRHCSGCGTRQPFRRPIADANGKRRAWRKVVTVQPEATRVAVEMIVLRAYDAARSSSQRTAVVA